MPRHSGVALPKAVSMSTRGCANRWPGLLEKFRQEALDAHQFSVCGVWQAEATDDCASFF